MIEWYAEMVLDCSDTAVKGVVGMNNVIIILILVLLIVYWIKK